MLSRLVGEGRFGTVSGSGFSRLCLRRGDGILVERDRRYAALSELLRTTPPLDFNGGGAGS
jgi:hypothetical protein